MATLVSAIHGLARSFAVSIAPNQVNVVVSRATKTDLSGTKASKYRESMSKK